MRNWQWENIIAAALLSAGIVVAALIAAPPRYAAFQIADNIYGRLDRTTGDIVRCAGDVCQRQPDHNDDPLSQFLNSN
ncbi:MAG: hypothetical protein KF780_07925 [Sphingomonas sp.]|nr:hypothetical protein [Sphingomonas sp.]